MNHVHKFVLLDANVLAGYYEPKLLLNQQTAAKRIRILLNAVKQGGYPWIRPLIPNICITEVFNVFSKNARLGWRGKLKKEHATAIHGKIYKRICQEFIKDIHNARLLEQWEVNRYHIMAADFVAPIDHHMRRKSKRELGAADKIIAGMAIWLVRLFGEEHFRLVTADNDLCKVLRKGRKIKDVQAESWGLRHAERQTEMDWSREIYPRVIHLERDKDKALRDFFGIWPLTTRVARPKKKKRITKSCIQHLVELYRDIGVSRDRLPHTPHMDRLREEFQKRTGLTLTTDEVWGLLRDRLKRGSGKLKGKT